MKLFHNAMIGKILVIGFAVAVHGLFALGAYYLGLFISGIILQDAPWLIQASAIGFAVLTFAGAMWGFIYMEYAREDVEAYSRMSGKSFKKYLYAVQIAIAGAELSSLAFRTYQVHDTFERLVIAFLGILFLVIAYCLGKIIHAMANRPFEVAVYRARQEAGRSIVDDAMKSVSKMTTEQKTRFYNGDSKTIDEVRGASHTERQEEEHRKRQREQEENAERESSRNFTRKLLNPFGDAQRTSQADPLSQQNGRRS